MKTLVVVVLGLFASACSPAPRSGENLMCTKKGGVCAKNDECCGGSCSIKTNKCM